MEKVYVCYSECYDGILEDCSAVTIGVASTKEKAIELIDKYANLHYAGRDVSPCDNCERNGCPDCKFADDGDKWRRSEEDHYHDGYFQLYDGEYGSWVRHYYLEFELDELQREES